MKNIYTGVTLCAIFAVTVGSAHAQTNAGYIRETPRSAQVETGMRLQAEVDTEGRTLAQVETRAQGSATTSERQAQVAELRTLAQERVKATMRQVAENREAALAARDEKRAEIEARIAAKKLAITNEMFTRIAERVRRAAQRIEDAATRLTDASALLRTRAEAFEEKGADVSATMTALAAVDARIATLKVSLVDLPEDAELAVSSSTPAEAWATARADFAAVIAEVHAIRALINEAAATIKEAARSLGARPAVEAEAEVDAEVDAEATTTSE